MAKSPFEIVLSDEERAELVRRVACYTVPHKVVQRAKMILYAAEGLGNAEIARRLETAAEVVGRWRKRFFEERPAGLEDRERTGRPRRFPPQEVAQVQALACELPRTQGVPLSRFSRAELHRLVVERSICEASASTIARWLAEERSNRGATAPGSSRPIPTSRPRRAGLKRPGFRRGGAVCRTARPGCPGLGD